MLSTSSTNRRVGRTAVREMKKGEREEGRETGEHYYGEDGECSCGMSCGAVVQCVDSAEISFPFMTCTDVPNVPWRSNKISCIIMHMLL